MKKVIPHDLNQATAKRVIDKAVAEYSKAGAEFNPTFKWVTDSTAKLSLTILKKTIEADITLGAADVTVDVTVPAAFKLFEKKALDTIDAEVQKWLKKAKKGEI